MYTKALLSLVVGILLGYAVWSLWVDRPLDDAVSLSTYVQEQYGTSSSREVASTSTKDIPLERDVDRYVVEIKDTRISVDIADTPTLRERGLSGRKELAQEEGLLFVFDTPGDHGFWMKDMKFPIDIIWIDVLGNISWIEHDLSPDSYPKVFSPSIPSLYVLEVASGTAKKMGWEVGDAVTLPRRDKTQ